MITPTANTSGVNSRNPLSALVQIVTVAPQPLPILPTATPTPTVIPTQIPTQTPVALTLADYGVVLEGTWLQTERDEILLAAIQTGNALSSHGAASTGTAAFREVLQGVVGGQQRKIKFSRIANGLRVCITAKTPDGAEFSANIQCHSDVIMNQYTAVHEFGHVLVGRTTIGGISSYLTRIGDPDGNTSSLNRLLNSSSDFVMGVRGYTLLSGAVTDWQRSDPDTDNGWGSAGLWDTQSYYGPYQLQPPPVGAGTPTPIPQQRSIPKLGPCGDGAPTPQPTAMGSPFTFQQNPCTFPSWLIAPGSLGNVLEVEEAAADMFLNWTYSSFNDQLWRGNNCYSNGCNDSGLSGQARNQWMDTQMSQLFIEFGW